MIQHANHLTISYQLLGRMLVIFLFCWLGWNVFSGEHIPVENGLGWDGAEYSRHAQLFPELLLNNNMDQYRLQRILPSGLIYLFFKAFNFPLTSTIMPTAFGLLNCVLLLFSAVIWRRIAIKFAWKPEVTIITFVGLFASYAILKMNTYYPILTDISGFFFSLLMFYFYLVKRSIAVLLTAILSAFVYPTLLYVGVVLFIFPLESKQISKQEANNFTKLVSFITALAIVSLGLIIHLKLGQKTLGGYYVFPLLGVSACALFLYLFAGISSFVPYGIDCLTSIGRGVWRRIFFAAIAVFALKIFMFNLSNGKPGILSFSLFIKYITTQALAYPFVFVICHVMYYGPIVLLMIYFWSEMINCLKQTGTGLFLVFGFYFFLSIGSESRQFITFLPMSIFVLGEVLSRKKIEPTFVYGFIFLSLLTSRFWLPHNHGEWPSLLTSPPEVTLSFPMQWYFMNHGPWLSHAMYVVQFILVSCLGVIIYLLSRKEITQEEHTGELT